MECKISLKMRLFNSFLILLVVLGVESRSLNYTIPSRPVVPPYYPNFSKPISILPQGTPVIPICSVNSPSACFKQWTNQAIPFSIQQGGGSPQFNYFVPSFVPDTRIRSNSIDKKGWKKSVYSRENDFGNRTFYFNEKKPDRIRMLETDSKGRQYSTEGRVYHMNLNDLEETNDSTGTTETEDTTQSENSTGSENTLQQDSGSATLGTRGFVDTADPDQAEGTGSSSTPTESIGPDLHPNSGGATLGTRGLGDIEPDHGEGAGSSSAPTESIRPALRPKDMSDSENSSYRNYQTSRDTIALPASGGSEVKPGCFRVNKMEVETQAAFCFECIRNTSENAYFNALLTENSFGSKLKNYLKRVRARSEGKVRSKIPKTSGDIADTQICSPFKQLKAVIGNFERTCPPPYNQEEKGFKRFFKETLCKSCKKGVPVELMMGMMSIESAGECTARNEDGENSAGLFQVDSNQHICKKGYKKGTERNAQCLAKIHNNWDKAIEILSTFYKNTNGKKLKKPCENWLDMESKDRDSFRRAVAGYNGGYWFLNAIRAAKNNTDEKDKSKYGLSYKHDKSNWEEVRAFYFMQHLKRNFKYKRRALKNDLSNLAHTEAILGREVKNSVPGMIEIWSQYKRDFLKQNPIQCR